MAESVTGENSSETFTCRRFLEDDRSVLDVAWKSSISARYSGFFVVIALKVRSAILNVIRAATGSQCSLARTRVIASPCPRNHPCKRVEDPLQLPEVLGGCSTGERSYSSRDGSRPSNLPPYKPSPRRYIHVYDARL